MKIKISKIVHLALAEDMGLKDLTGELISKESTAQANIICQQPAVIYGIKLVNQVFAAIDPKIKISWLVADGQAVTTKTVLCQLQGDVRSILAGERTALNFLQTLSSSATLTRKFVAKLKGSKTQLLDTRKTLPGLRLAQKEAVKAGGGTNHRLGLYDGVLIKENHIAACGSITQAIQRAKKLYPNKPIEVEVRNLPELHEALANQAKWIMLDNFTLKNIRAAVKITRGRAKLELSGGVNLKNIQALAKTGVDYISVGLITKTVVPIELSLLVTKLGSNKNK